MKNRFNNAIRFKNGNIHIKWNKNDIEDITKGYRSEIEMLSYDLEDVDTYIIDEILLGNANTGLLLYSAFSGKCFIISDDDIYKRLANGLTVYLYAFNPSEDEKEMINKYWEN